MCVKLLSRLSLSFYHVTVLKHIRDKLAVYRFKADMAAFLELDMLTTAFVATYVRLHTGGSGSGFARDALPEALRSAHDEIIDMRNKRYAHVAEHDSRSEEHTSELQSLMRISYAVFCLKKKTT